MVYDQAPWGRRFGEVKDDISAAYTLGEVVQATFVGANPRNNLRLEGTFVAVEKRVARGRGPGTAEEWETVRDDRDWDLRFKWKRTSKALGFSEVEVVWETGVGRVEPGVYRLRYFGDAKSITGSVSEFEGTSGSFTIQ